VTSNLARSTALGQSPTLLTTPIHTADHRCSTDLPRISDEISPRGASFSIPVDDLVLTCVQTSEVFFIHIGLSLPEPTFTTISAIGINPDPPTSSTDQIAKIQIATFSGTESRRKPSDTHSSTLLAYLRYAPMRSPSRSHHDSRRQRRQSRCHATM
jgi:hypothetical protein